MTTSNTADTATTENQTTDVEVITIPTEVATVPQLTIAEAFKPNGLDPILFAIKKVADDFMAVVRDPNDKKQADEIKSFAFRLAKAKTHIEKQRKDYVADRKKALKEIDSEGNRAVTFLENLQKAVRRPVTELEEAEKLAKELYDADVNSLRSLGNDIISMDSNQAKSILDQIASLKDKHSTDEWMIVHRNALKKAQEYVEQRTQWEKDQEELAELRKHKAEQERLNREKKIADQARIDAEKKLEEAQAMATAAIIEAEEAKKETELAAQKALEQERKRQEAETKRLAEEEEKRKADVEHRRAINKSAAQALIDHGMSDKAAMEAIKLIAKGVIPNVTIKY